MLKAGVVVFCLIVVLAAGFFVPPSPYPALSAAVAPPEQSLPRDLPPPVLRFYRALYGEHVPQVTTATITGNGKLRLSGLTLPARFRFTHLARQGYRHDIQVTWYGLAIMTVRELFLEGEAHLELPGGVVEKQPRVNQAANLALWSEAVWFPSLWIQNSMVHWETVDDHTALLKVPWKDTLETFVVRFDPQTGLLQTMASMRYKEASSPRPTLWLNEVLRWEPLAGQLQPLRVNVVWFDEKWPWAQLTVHDVQYNLPLTQDLLPANP